MDGAVDGLDVEEDDGEDEGCVVGSVDEIVVGLTDGT